MARMRWFFGMMLAGFGMFMVLFTYLVDFKRLRTDLGHWLTQIDAYERRADTGSEGRPGS